MNKTVKDRFNDFMSLIPDSSDIVVGLSGGSDSVVLLHLLKEWADGNSSHIHALHVNHMIRGEEADRDEEFCRLLCEKLSIGFESVKADVPKEAQRLGIGLEECARNIRYSLLYSHLEKTSSKYIALAHNSTDNLETVIFNITRGAGGNGICGIPALRDNIIRPLLNVSKSEIEEYARINSLSFVTDSTNSDTAYTRNKIRHEIIPILKTINPSVEDAVLRMCSLLKQDKLYIENEVLSFESEDRCEILASLDGALIGRIIRKRTESDLSLENTERIKDLIKKSAGDKGYRGKATLPGGYTAKVSNGKISFGKEDETEEDRAYSLVLSEGKNSLPFGAGKILIAQDTPDEPNMNENGLLFSETLYFDGIPELVARTRRPEDKIKSREITKKVKKIFNEMKISLEEREIYPLICDKDGIVWIPGYAKSDRVLKGSNKIRIFYFYERKN